MATLAAAKISLRSESTTNSQFGKRVDQITNGGNPIFQVDPFEDVAFKSTDTIILGGNCPSVVAKVSKPTGMSEDISNRNIKSVTAVKCPTYCGISSLTGFTR